MPSVYLGLGSNLGDRAVNIWEAVRRLQDLPGSRLARLSALYETEPVGPVAQGWFLNAALHLSVSLGPHDLLRAAKEVERALGRLATERWGPRIIDIDLLLYGQVRVRSEELIVPHPELWNRRFVLMPLLDVVPPGPLQRKIAAQLQALDQRPVVRPYDPKPH